MLDIQTYRIWRQTFCKGSERRVNADLVPSLRDDLLLGFFASRLTPTDDVKSRSCAGSAAIEGIYPPLYCPE